ncbi:MAG: nucleoside hydrolase, partial [candidate division NC10 bacterium]
MTLRAKGKSIILDTDPGIGTPGSDVDDGLAIVLGLLHPACDLLGLTIVAGNVLQEEALPNALRLLEIAGRTGVPVVPGATRPLLRDPSRIRELLDGRRRAAVERFWDLGSFEPPKLKPAGGRAAEFIADTVRGRPGEVTIVAIGPCTNVAAALLLDPAVARSVAEIVVMGGAIRV